MRLTPIQIRHIKSAVEGFDDKAKIYLFGSRADDAAKGGDIDLLVFSDCIGLQQKIELKLHLIDLLGAQKIDLVIARDEKQPFVRLARSEGVPL